jgi:predicted phosphodiesterase
MRLAVLSDIHSNYEAFKQVLEDIDKSRVDAAISLGDNIGYGPEPERVIQAIKARNIATVQGNHELAIKEDEYLSWFNPAARKSLIKTRSLLSEASVRFVSQLEPALTAYECRFVHGFPPDSPLIYMFQVPNRRKKQVLEEAAERLCFIGHTHTLDIIAYDGQHVDCQKLLEGPTSLDGGKKYIINIGSVGQPRDADNKAKYIIWDSSASTIDVRFVRYDIAVVAQKIQDAGLPEEHALRLW